MYRHCPDHLFSSLIKVVIEEIRKACKKDPLSYGFNSNDNGVYNKYICNKIVFT